MELRWYQQEAVNTMINAKGNSIVVLPTGSGKTLVIAEFVKQYKGKILILSHVREILAQNYEALARYLDGSVSMFSAGWGMRDVGHITVAGIQSVYKSADKFSGVGVVLIDECHLVNKLCTGMYRTFLSDLGAKTLGLTATPFRLGQGYLHIGEDSLFDSICYDLSDKIPRLQKEGYLSRLKSRAPKESLDITDIRTVNGDFSTSEMDERFVDHENMKEIVAKLTTYSDHKKWLVFCINIKHAELIADMLNSVGITARPVHSKMDTATRDHALDQFKRKEIQALVNVNVLTTGFDAPDIDLIVMLRPTKSASLYSQMVGRGLRVAPGKEYCTVLDYAGNIERLGPINNLRIDKEGKVNPNAIAPEKICPECDTYVSLAARTCPVCGADLRPEPTSTLETTASDAQLVAEEVSPKVKWHKVVKVMYTRHRKAQAPDSVKVSYYCGARVFREWICLEHQGGAGRKAFYRLSARWMGDNPKTVQEFLDSTASFTAPTHICVDDRGQYPNIIDKNYS